ncbi:WD repeat-containing protein 49 isoform X1 [Pygocentrus nattereri]|uniref:WD repeat-containing protein 49 isoform X1 n=1 Tax=Pygocentrus nattereri TaxID=42514 RepID=UPI0008142AA8|nr:WD repeat-containing protein 49 isoform X1 [Pygocentrus nattereri]
MATEVKAELLESRLSMEDFMKMQSLFLMSGSSVLPMSMQRAEFVERCCSVIGRGSQEEYSHLFDSVDVSREGWVDWERLATFLLLGLSNKEEHAKAAAVPRWRPARTLPTPHRDTIHSITHLPTSGRYLSVSKEGTLAVWDEKNLTLLRNHRLSNDSVKPKDLWVTGMVVLPNVHKIACSFTSKEICFYDLLSKQELSLQYKLHGLHYTPISLHYWHHPQRPEQAVLSFGDVGGQVSGVCFRSALISLFERPSAAVEQDSAVSISWAELQQGCHRCCYTVTHTAHTGHWVRTVRFLGSLEAFVSCSSSAQNSMVLAWREGETRPLRVATFHTENGIIDLDYHPGLNFIATAGENNQVCLWNPYLISKPVGVLRGHVTSVVAVRFMLGKKQLISFSKDKVLRVWDMATQLCVQRIAGIFPKTQECRTLLFFHEERSRLFLSFNSALLLLEAKKESGRRVMSHESAVTCVLYNSLFRQVVSSDASSAVTCWLMDTGQKVKQFHRCHGDAEISTMALDTTQTRLFTAGTDGVVKVWDFNGHCHHSLNAGRGLAVEIAQILVLKRTVLVLGWERTITVFRLNSFSQYFVQPAEWKGGVQHRDDVVCAAFRSPQTLVTGSSDGEIIMWNNSTEIALCKLSSDSTPPQDLKSKSDNTLSKTSISNARRPSTNSASKLLALCGKEDSESYGITRLAVVEGRMGAAATGGADLVSCGGLGVVRFWNTISRRLVGEFVAHKDSGSIVLTVDSSGRYLATADMDGRVKVWDIQDYCLHPTETVTNQAPALLSSLRPHVNCVTHLETCVHGDQLFLLSASTDCSLALSFLPGPTIGIFGQEVHWHLGGPGVGLLEKVKEVKSETSRETDESSKVQQSSFCNLESPQSPESARTDHHTPAEDEDEEKSGTQQPHILCDSVAEQGQDSEDGCGVGLPLSDSKQRPYVNGVQNSSVGALSELRLEELDTVGELTKPDFVINPHLYFGLMWESSAPTPPPLPEAREKGLKAAIDEKSLFPKEVLEQVDRPPGAQHHTQRVSMMRNYGRFIGRRLGKPKASASGVFKAK